MRRLFGVAGLALASVGIGAVAAPAAAHPEPNSKRGKQRSPDFKYQGSSIATERHLHAREIARRARQAERIKIRQAERLARSRWGRDGLDEYMGMSRRGLLIGAGQ